MAYGYLLAPSFQFVNINGRPIANGHIEVFLTNTDTKYITKCDFNGTDNPFKIPLNSKGMAVVIASGDYAYDVFCYDRFGSLFWSGSNIRIEGATGVVIDGANLPLRIVGGKIDNNGKELTCTGENAWAEGAETTASGANAHAEGGLTTASGEHSHSEGFSTTASSGYCHAEGAGSKASNTASHAEGQDTTASGQASHAEGRGSVASGDYSHASGRGTRATGEGSTAVGKWNDDGDALFVVGGGTASNNRKDVFKVDRNGDTWVLVNNSLVRVNNCSQFVLTRSNMTTAFTNDEYSDCVNSVTNGIAVCVQLGTSLQLQLTQISSLGIHFEATFGDYHYMYVVAPTANAHTISENIRHFGTPIYATLQDAISDADALHVGMYFETNGFHTSGDGGAARYYVSSSGTANGKNIVQLAPGKNAYLQYGEWVCPEEIGYNHSDDVVPYITHAISTMGVQHIKLLARGTYHWKTTLVVNMVNGFELVGEGDWGNPRKFTYIKVDPTENIGCMVKLAGRSITLKNLDIEVTGSQKLLIDGITSDSYADGAEFYFTFDNIRMNSFKECWKLAGGIKWHCIFNECQPANCKIGIHFFESSTMLVNMKEVYFNHCADIGLWFEGNVYTAKIDACNFGSMNTAVKLSVNSSQYLYQNVRFDCCNFEDDNVSTGSRDAVFIDAYDDQHLDIRQNITISNSNFTLAKRSAPVQDITNRYIRLGKKTNIVLINNQILGVDEPEHPEWVVYPKLMWNTSVIPTEGSITEVGNNLFFDYPDVLAPYAFRNGRAIGFRCSNAEDPTQSALSDCNDFFPLHNGEMRTARVSTYESTTNMPASNIFGYLMVFGVIDNPNKRVLQVLFASNNNIYTRVIRDIGNGWTYLAWKTITAT